MSAELQGITTGGLLCFAAGPPSDGRFLFIPGPPSPETASLMASPEGAQLSLQAIWSAKPDALQAARDAVEAGHPGAASVDLAAADLADLAATLTLTLPQGREQTFGPNSASGMGKQRVVFSERLTAAEKEAAASAFAGQSGVLTLTYAGTLTTEESSVVKLTGDLAARAKLLVPAREKRSGGFFGRARGEEGAPPPGPDLEACAKAVDAAVEAGQVTLNAADTANASDAMKRGAEAKARSAAARFLFDQLRRLGADVAALTSLGVSVEGREAGEGSFEVRRSADLGAWLAANGGADLVSQVSAPIPEPRR